MSRQDATAGPTSRAEWVQRKARGVRRRGKAVVRAAQGKPPLTKPRPPQGNPLREYFDGNTGRLMNKWPHYFDIYHRHFARFRNRQVTVVEFGVSHGGSLQMWREYFGPKARIVGVDIDPRCAEMDDIDAEIVIGDQEDREFLRTLARDLGQVHVLIEDGGHTMAQQLATFQEFWPRVAENGVYLVEDLHTSYWENYDGGYKRPGTFIEFAKDLIDQLHAWYTHDPQNLHVDGYTTTIRGMHVYDSVIVFDKGVVERPEPRQTGTPSF